MGFVRGAKLTKKVAFMTTDKSDIEALACDIYNAHRTERIIAGAKNVASWWGMDARNREHWMKVARRLQPARVLEGYVSITDYPPPRNETVVYWHKQADGPGFPAIADEWRDEHHASFAAGWHPQASFAAPQPDGLDWLEGPWRVSEDAHHIHNDNFDSDVMLVLSGTFESCQHRHDVANAIAERLASAPQPTQRGGEGVEAVKQSLTGGGKNE